MRHKEMSPDSEPPPETTEPATKGIQLASSLHFTSRRWLRADRGI